MESPTFTGTVLFPAGSTFVCPAAAGRRYQPDGRRFSARWSLTETNSISPAMPESPTRRALAFADGQASSVELSTITAAPLKPVVAWGENDQGQTTVPSLSSAQAIAAGEYP